MKQFFKITGWIALGITLQILASYFFVSHGRHWWVGFFPQLASGFVYYWLYRDVPGPKRLLHNLLALLQRTLSLPSGNLTILLFIPRRGRLYPRFVYPRGILPKYHLDVSRPVPEGLEGKAFRTGKPVSEEGMPTTDDGEQFSIFGVATVSIEKERRCLTQRSWQSTAGRFFQKPIISRLQS